MRDKPPVIVEVVAVAIAAVIAGGIYFHFRNSPVSSGSGKRAASITTNLRLLGTTASAYMLDKQVTQVGYYDLVGTSSDSYIRNLAPEEGEDYTGIVIYQTTTQVSVSTRDGKTVVFSL